MLEEMEFVGENYALIKIMVFLSNGEDMGKLIILRIREVERQRWLRNYKEIWLQYNAHFAR